MSRCIMSVMILVVIIRLERKKSKQIRFFFMFCLCTLIFFTLFQNTFVPFSLKFDKFFSFFVVMLYSSYVMSKFIIDKIYLSIKVKCCIFQYKLYYFISITISYVLIVRALFIVIRIGYNELRSQIVNGTISVHSSIVMALLSSLMYLANIRNENIRKKMQIAISMIMMAALSTSKMYFIIAILYIVPWYTYNFKVNLSTILFVVICGVGSFFWIHVVTDRVVGKSQNLVQNLLFTLKGYYLGGLAAFQIVLDDNYIGTGWIRTGEWIGNVYSAFLSLFYEKSYLLFGSRVALIGFTYALLSKDNYLARYVKVYSWLPMFMIFFGEMFGSAISQWICFVIAGFFVSMIQNNNRKVNIFNSI